MDLVKARKRAKQAAGQKDGAKKQAPKKSAAKNGAGKKVGKKKAKAPGKRSAEKKKAKKPAPEPAAPPETPAVEEEPPGLADVFMDDAFGEDLPPLLPGEEPPDDAVLGEMEMADGPSPKLEVPEDEDYGVDQDDELFWEVKDASRPDAVAAEPTAAPPKTAPETEKAKPRPASAVEAPVEEEKKFVPVRFDDDDAADRPPAPSASQGLDKVEMEWEDHDLSWSLGVRESTDDDFFHLVTEDLYAREFGRGEDEELGAQLELLSFRLATEVYAVRLTSIRQIIKLAAITIVPRAPEYVLGVISLRGTIIPVFDLRRRMSLPAADPTRKSRIVVVAQGKYIVGLIVDEVEQVVRLPEAGLEPPPSVLAGVAAEYIEGIGRTARKMIILLALEKIMVPVVAGRE